MGLAIFQMRNWQVPWDLPISEFKSGKSFGTCHFSNKKMASPMGLAIIRIQKWQVPWDLPLLELKNCKSRGTCHSHNLMFQPVLTPLKMASPMKLATPHNLMKMPRIVGVSPLNIF